jgi:phage tail protein X
MRLITIDKETDLGTLADRLYQELTPETRTMAEVALLRANPGLAQRDALRPGLIVTVPEVTGVRLNTAAAAKDPAGDLVGALKNAVAVYRKQLADNFAVAADEINTQRELLSQRDVTAAIAAAPGAGELAKNLAAMLTERGKAVAEGQKTVSAAFDTIAKDLDSI